MSREDSIMPPARYLLSSVSLLVCLGLPGSSSAAVAPSPTISVTAGSGGKVTPRSSTARPGTNRTFTIKPLKGHHVAEVRLDGATIFEDRKAPDVPNDGAAPPPPSDPGLQRSGVSKVYKYTFRNLQEDHALEAMFEPDTFPLAVVKAGLGAGVVTSTPGGISCGGACAAVFPYGTVVTLSAVPDERSIFDGWGAKRKAKGATMTIRMTKAAAVTARFARAFKLSISVHGPGSVTSSPRGMTCAESCEFLVKDGTTVKLKARAARDSIFLGWTGPTKSAGATGTIAMDQDQLVIAAFASKRIPAYDLDVEDLPKKVILEPPPVVPNARGAYGHCYLESFAVQMAYIDPGVTMEEVFTFSGLGAALCYSAYGKSFVGSPPGDWTWPLHTRAMRGYGVDFILGHSPGISRKHLEGACAEIVHESAEEALTNLKAAIRTGRPVQVHIDLAYLFPGSGWQPGASHFIVISGYDEDAVYWTDPEPSHMPRPVDPSAHVNVRVDLEDFLRAWEEAGNINKGEFTYAAPYWMLFLEETHVSQVRRMAVGDILSLHASLSQNNASVIDEHILGDFSGTQWWRIAMARRLFAEYLKGNGFVGAAERYALLAEEYAECEELPVDRQREKLGGSIRSLEVEARTSF